MRKWVKDMSSVLRVSEGDLKKYTGRFGNLFSQIGFSSEKMKVFSQDVLKLGADIAYFNNQNPERVFEAMAKAVGTGEFEMLKDAADITLYQEEVLARQIETNRHSLNRVLNNMYKAEVVMELIREKSKEAIGTTAREAEGLTGVWGEFTTKLKNYGSQIASSLIPYLKEIIDNMTKGIDKLKLIWGGKHNLTEYKDALHGLTDLANLTVDIITSLVHVTLKLGQAVTYVKEAIGLGGADGQREVTQDELTLGDVRTTERFERQKHGGTINRNIRGLRAYAQRRKDRGEWTRAEADDFLKKKGAYFTDEQLENQSRLDEYTDEDWRNLNRTYVIQNANVVTDNTAKELTEAIKHNTAQNARVEEAYMGAVKLEQGKARISEDKKSIRESGFFQKSPVSHLREQNSRLTNDFHVDILDN